MDHLYLTVTTADVVQKTTDFFTIENLKILWNQFLTGTAGYIWKIVVAIIIWYIGKKLVRFGVKVMNKALSRTDLDTGVVKFLCSLTRFSAYIILLIQIIKILGFETSTFVALIGSAGLAFGLALQGSLSNFAGGVLILIF
jgi:small conductance mechanosensitive channel